MWDRLVGEATPELAHLAQSARQVLKGNDLGASTKPAPGLYPHQWNWDSAFIAIGLSRFDTDRAATEVRSLLRGQWSNGMVPQIVFNPHATGYFPGPDVWQSERSPDAPKDVKTSGITQPPILATACRAVWENASDRTAATDFLRDVYPHLLAYHRFFYELRNPDGDGLIVVVHPWESGLDNSPPYLDAGGRVKLAYRPQYQRLDLQHVSAAQRPSNKDYDLFVYLLEQMRDVDWDQKRYLQHAPLQVQDVLFNSILCRANEDLGAIARIVGESPDQALAWKGETAKAINERLWDEEANTYFSYDRVAGELLHDDTIGGFAPLYGEVATEDRAERLFGTRLQNPKMYWPANGYAVPTTALDSPWFNGENYWLGPVWISTNWLVIHGLADYGHAEPAARLASMTVDLVRRSGFHEYFNPYSGQGYGTDSFSWTAALTIDLIAAMEGPAGG